jgi:hypothetical protein
MTIARPGKFVVMAAVLVALLLGGFFLALSGKSGDKNQVRISKVPGGVLVDLQRVYSTGQPYSIAVPLEYLDLRAKDINDFKTNCSCTVPALDKDATEINIELDLLGKSGDIYQSIAVIPISRQLPPKIIRIKGEVIPGWYWQPSVVQIDDLKPNEARTFKCLVEIQYDVGPIAVKELKLSPPFEHAELAAEVTDGRPRIMITGKLKGPGQKCHYKGRIDLDFEAQWSHRVSVPIEINAEGAIQVTPEVVTTDRHKITETTVSLEHYLGNRLEITSVVCPKFLTARVAGAKIFLSLNTNMLPEQTGPISSNISIFFSDFDQPTLLPVLIL